MIERSELIKVHRTCPICGSHTAYNLHKQRFEGLEASPITADYQIVSCKECGFTYADTISTQEEYNMYYEYLSKYEDEKASGSGMQSTPYDEKRLIESAEIIAKYVPKEKSIIDVGCANGGLLEALKKKGYNYLTGVDPSKICVEHIKDRGIQGYQGNLFALDEKASYDALILTHVLEHIRDLEKAVECVKKSLKEDGILYVEMPNAGCYDTCFVVPYYFFDVEHINHFDTVSLQNLLGEFECLFIEEVVQQVSEHNNYPVLRAVFRKIENKKHVVSCASKAYQSILKHIEQSKEAFEKLNIINELVETKEPVIIWGAGQYTQRLLATTKLAECNIQAFIDNDSNKQGKKILGKEIKGKEALNNLNGKIIVCCALASGQIVKEIKEMGIGDEVIVL